MRPLVLAALCASLLSGQDSWTDAQKKEFLLTASLEKAPDSNSGAMRATLRDGAFAHEAVISTTNMNNVAAYELSVLLKLPMVPVAVQRKLEQAPAAWTWSVDEAMMTEGDRNQKHAGEPPDAVQWDRQMQVFRIFDQLVRGAETDPNSIIIDRNWKIWASGLTKAFPDSKQISEKREFAKCDRVLLARLRRLDSPSLQASPLAELLTKSQIQALASRARQIVRMFEDEVRKKGPANVLYDWLPAK